MNSQLCARYYRANHTPVTLSHTQLSTVDKNSGLLWISLIDPCNSELEQLLPQVLADQPRVLDEIKLHHRRPKVIDYSSCTLIVALAQARTHAAATALGEVQLLFGQGFVISIWRNTEINDAALRNELESSPELFLHGADYLVAEQLNTLVDHYSDRLTRYEKRVERVEKRFFSGDFAKADIEQAFQLRRELLRIHTVVSPLSELARRFVRQPAPYINNYSRAYFSEVADRIARLAELINVYRDTIAFAFEGGAMIIQLQQTDISRKLAAWAAILAIPTALAGIYGMNFKNMPELDWNFGYPLIIGVMGSICVGLYRKFKKMAWL